MEEMIAGRHAVLEALRSERAIHKIWISEQAQRTAIQPIIAEAKQRRILIQHTDRRRLDQMAGEVRHQGVIAQAAAYEYAEIDDILAIAAQKQEDPLLFILDEIEDPHNLGSIMRTAASTGVHGIIIPKRRSVGLTAAVARTAAGAIEYVPVARVTNIAQTIEQLKKQGVWIAGTDVAADTILYDQSLTMPLAVVIGNEHKGMSRLTSEKCDFLIKLPMTGPIQSLNASVAAAIVMFEIVRQRHYVKE